MLEMTLILRAQKLAGMCLNSHNSLSAFENACIIEMGMVHIILSQEILHIY